VFFLIVLHIEYIAYNTKKHMPYKILNLLLLAYYCYGFLMKHSGSDH